MSWLFRSRDPRKKTGGAGETSARKFYEARGAVVLSRNFRCRLGEIDLVVEEGGVIVFVEVKSSSQRGGLAPELRVGRDKRRRLTRLAEFYLSYKKLHGRPARFDVVAVVPGEDPNTPEIVHYLNAFGVER